VEKADAGTVKGVFVGWDTWLNRTEGRRRTTEDRGWKKNLPRKGLEQHSRNQKKIYRREKAKKAKVQRSREKI